MRSAGQRITRNDARKWLVLLLVCFVAINLVVPGLHAFCHGGHSCCAPGSDSLAAASAVETDDDHAATGCSLCWFVQHHRWLLGCPPAGLRLEALAVVERTLAGRGEPVARAQRGIALARGPPRRSRAGA